MNLIKHLDRQPVATFHESVANTMKVVAAHFSVEEAPSFKQGT